MLENSGDIETQADLAFAPIGGGKGDGLHFVDAVRIGEKQLKNMTTGFEVEAYGAAVVVLAFVPYIRQNPDAVFAGYCQSFGQFESAGKGNGKNIVLVRQLFHLVYVDERWQYLDA